ncbi:MAG: hypothetical protein IT370_01100 [Deltaproteobacteria bacterium]|nr:hypothetical protein [Deltaproteobacteria bacterium]
MTRRLPRALGHLLRCLVLGALLLALRQLVALPRRAGAAPLLVSVAADASRAEIERAVADAALVDLALRARWPMADPVVRDLLLAAMRADDPEGAAETLIARGIALGMTRRDPATRARLAWLGREILRARVRTVAPGAAALAAYRAAHHQRYAAGWLVLRQRLVSSARHGERTLADAQALVARLAGADGEGRSAGAGPVSSGAAGGDDDAAGDPTLLPARIAGTRAAIDARFGPGFAAQLADAPLGRWSGPYAGSFGQHVVWLEQRRYVHPGSAAAIEQRVLADWHEDALEAELTRATRALAAGREIALERVAP